MENKLPPWKYKIKHFTLSWFSVCMGTGIVSEVLYLMPYRAPGQRTAAVVFFFFNIVLFTLFTIITLLRYFMFPKIPLLLLRHPIESCYVGTVPMAWATIVNMAVLTGARYGTGIVTIAFAAWWADVIMSLITCLLVTYLMVSRHEHAMTDTSSLWLLPIVSAPVASTSATIILPHLSDQHAYPVLLVGYALWGFGEMLSAMILMLYLQRLIYHHLPPRQLIVSIWLPIGFLGQGVTAILGLGRYAKILLPRLGNELEQAGPVFYHVGAWFAILLWGFSLWWLFIAICAVLDHLPSGFPFSMGWFSFTFPLGSLATGTIALGEVYNAPFFYIVGEIMSWSTIALYGMVMLLTCRQAYRGTLFYAPCLTNAPDNLKR